MTVSVLFLVGRFLLAVPFVLLGVEGLTRGSAARRVGHLVGVLAAGAVVLGWWGDLAAVVLGAQVLVLRVLAPAEPGPEARLTGVGLLGACVVTAACFAAVGAALDWTLTGPLWDLDLR